MKLLELLVQAKVQWPEGALWAVQDADGDVKFNPCEVPPYIANPLIGWWVSPVPGARFTGRRYTSLQLSDDWATKAVSKAEYDDAVAASAAQHACPEDATCTDQGCPHHYASEQPYYVPVHTWYAELAPIIAAAAEGKVVQYLAADGNWYDGSGAFIHPNKYRIKPEEPKTIKVNGFDVPEPMRELIPVGTPCYLADAAVSKYYSEFYWTAAESDTTWLARGLLHDTVEAAVAHAKAMLGIDPYANEDADDEHS